MAGNLTGQYQILWPPFSIASLIHFPMLFTRLSSILLGMFDNSSLTAALKASKVGYLLSCTFQSM